MFTKTWIAAAVIALSAKAAIAETGTMHLIGAGPDCYKVTLLESGTKYAVDYASTSGPAAKGLTSILSDGDGNTLIIETDGTQPATCGNGTFYRITGLTRIH